MTTPDSFCVSEEMRTRRIAGRWLNSRLEVDIPLQQRWKVFWKQCESIDRKADLI